MALLLTGLMQYLPKDKPDEYLYLNLFSRLIAGYGESLTFTVVFSLVPLIWNGE